MVNLDAIYFAIFGDTHKTHRRDLVMDFGVNRSSTP